MPQFERSSSASFEGLSSFGTNVAQLRNLHDGPLVRLEEGGPPNISGGSSHGYERSFHPNGKNGGRSKRHEFVMDEGTKKVYTMKEAILTESPRIVLATYKDSSVYYHPEIFTLEDREKMDVGCCLSKQRLREIGEIYKL